MLTDRTHKHREGSSSVIVLGSGRSIDLRNVDPSRLMTIDECRDIAAALRSRLGSIESRIRLLDTTGVDASKARSAYRLTHATRLAVLGRMTFLARHGDQHIDHMTDAARFVAVAKERLGREVFEMIMSEARRLGGVHAVQR